MGLLEQHNSGKFDPKESKPSEELLASILSGALSVEERKRAWDAVKGLWPQVPEWKDGFAGNVSHALKALKSGDIKKLFSSSAQEKHALLSLGDGATKQKIAQTSKDVAGAAVDAALELLGIEEGSRKRVVPLLQILSTKHAAVGEAMLKVITGDSCRVPECKGDAHAIVAELVAALGGELCKVTTKKGADAEMVIPRRDRPTSFSKDSPLVKEIASAKSLDGWPDDLVHPALRQLMGLTPDKHFPESEKRKAVSDQLMINREFARQENDKALTGERLKNGPPLSQLWTPHAYRRGKMEEVARAQWLMQISAVPATGDDADLQIDAAAELIQQWTAKTPDTATLFRLIGSSDRKDDLKASAAVRWLLGAMVDEVDTLFNTESLTNDVRDIAKSARSPDDFLKGVARLLIPGNEQSSLDEALIKDEQDDPEDSVLKMLNTHPLPQPVQNARVELRKAPQDTSFEIRPKVGGNGPRETPVVNRRGMTDIFPPEKSKAPAETLGEPQSTEPVGNQIHRVVPLQKARSGGEVKPEKAFKPVASVQTGSRRASPKLAQPSLQETVRMSAEIRKRQAVPLQLKNA